MAGTKLGRQRPTQSVTMPYEQTNGQEAADLYAQTGRATLESPPLLQSGVSRLVKQAGADTTLKNALRDGAEFAWIPHGGETCAFCITLASRGWQRASKRAIKNGHAEHIHANCKCEYAIRFDNSTTVAGYDPEKYLEQYNAAGGDINAMRREQYAQNKDRINAQKRAAYEARKLREGLEDVFEEYQRTATPGRGAIACDEGYDRTRHAAEIKTAQWLHDHLGGDIELLNEARKYKVMTPDYRWRGRLWDLKTVTTEKAANSAVRHGLKQIQGNPGGIILDYGENGVSLSELKTILQKRLSASAQTTVDILVLQNGEYIAVLRYKK